MNIFFCFIFLFLYIFSYFCTFPIFFQCNYFGRWYFRLLICQAYESDKVASCKKFILKVKNGVKMVQSVFCFLTAESAFPSPLNDSAVSLDRDNRITNNIRKDRNKSFAKEDSRYQKEAFSRKSVEVFLNFLQKSILLEVVIDLLMLLFLSMSVCF